MVDPILKIDDSHLEAIMAKAILETITPEVRDSILASTINHLMSQDTDVANRYPYDKRPSRLQHAFNQAVEIKATQIAQQVIMEDERLQEKVKELIPPLIDEIMTADYDGRLQRAVAKAIINTVHDIRAGARETD